VLVWKPEPWHSRRQPSCPCPQRLLAAACALRAVVGARNGDSFPTSERSLQQVATKERQLLEFPVLLEPDDDSTAYGAAIFLRLPGNWSGTTLRPCVSIVERAEQCTRTSLDVSTCSSRALWKSSILTSFLGFEVPRPSFARGSHLLAAAHNHSVCFYATGNAGEVLPWEQSTALPLNASVLSGRVVYSPVPKVRFIDTVVGIGVRTFLNPGWHREIQIQCTNCSSANRITLAPIIPETRCAGVMQQALAAAAAAARDSEMPEANLELHKSVPMALQAIIRGKGENQAGCVAPARSPCSGYADQAFSVTSPKFDPHSAHEAVLDFDSVVRLLVQERRLMFHHRSAICFYANEAMPHGWLIGFAALHMDSGDMQAFVVFVCFFGVVLPLICMATALLHINKQERCKQHIQQLRDQVQREQLADELSDRGLGGSGGSPHYPNSTAGQRDGSLPSSLTAAMTEMVGGPRRSRTSASHDFAAMVDDVYAEMIAQANHQWTVVNAREFRAQLEEVRATARQARERLALAGSALASSQAPAGEDSSDGAQDSGVVEVSDSVSSPLVAERPEDVGVF